MSQRPDTPTDFQYGPWRKKPGPAPAAASERLAAHIRIDAETGCHVWTGATGSGGYGLIRGASRRNLGAHRVAYEAAKGAIPAGMHIDHLCRNRRCCNPDHLEAVTPAENNLRSGSPSAQNARKTHCPQGHAYTPENTYRKPGAPNTRNCRACQRERNRRVKARRRVRAMFDASVAAIAQAEGASSTQPEPPEAA